MEAESYKQTTWLLDQQKNAPRKYPTTIQMILSFSNKSIKILFSTKKKTYAPRFLLIHAEKEDEIVSSLSPFLVHKTTMSLTGEPKSIKNLRSGDLLIQCVKEKHETILLKLKNFCGLKCKVTSHYSLNISKGIVRCPALNRQACEHILEFMGEQGVTYVRRISVFRDGLKKPTDTFVFTFNTPVLPSVV